MSDFESFCFRLALTMGVAVDEVLEWDQITLRRWQEWSVKNPFGFEIDDYLASKICAVLCSVVSGFTGGGKTYSPKDFMYKAERNKPMTDDEIRQVFNKARQVLPISKDSK